MAHISPADCVIKAFGGVRKTARALGRQPGAIIKWKERGFVPNALQPEILKHAREGRCALTAETLIIGRDEPDSADQDSSGTYPAVTPDTVSGPAGFTGRKRY